MSTRQAIIRAADTLFCEKGFDATSTRAIATASGVTLGLIHYHFESKDALYRCVMDDYYRRLVASLAGAFQAACSPNQRIHRVIDAYVDFLSENIGFSRIVQREAADPQRSEGIRRRIEPMYRAALQIAHDAFPATRSGALMAEDLLVSFFGMVASSFTYGHIVSALRGEDVLSSDALEARKQHLRRMVDIVLEQISPALDDD